MLSRRSALLRPAPTAARPLHPFPGSPVIGEHRFPPPRRRRGRDGSPQFPGRPSARSTPNTPEGSSAPASGSQTPSMAFAVTRPARHPLSRPHGRVAYRRLLRLHSRCRPHGRSRPASHPASRPRTGASLPRTRTSPRTGLTPAGHPELIARTYLMMNSFSSWRPSSLGAPRGYNPHPPASLCSRAAWQPAPRPSPFRRPLPSNGVRGGPFPGSPPGAPLVFPPFQGKGLAGLPQSYGPGSRLPSPWSAWPGGANCRPGLRRHPPRSRGIAVVRRRPTRGGVDTRRRRRPRSDAASGARATRHRNRRRTRSADP